MARTVVLSGSVVKFELIFWAVLATSLTPLHLSHV